MSNLHLLYYLRRMCEQALAFINEEIKDRENGKATISATAQDTCKKNSV